MKRHKLLALCTVIMLISPVALSPRQAGAVTFSPNTRYFIQTGHNLSFGFKAFFEANGDVPIFGYPITEEFQEQNPPPPFGDGKVHTVQYFQRARFEYHPENPVQFSVLLGLLGTFLNANRLNQGPFAPIPPFPNHPDIVFFPETGHSLGFGFKNYFDTHGGLPIFGFPISQEFDEQNPPPPAGDGLVHTVQYFQRARFEFHPEFAGTPSEVELGLLGQTAAQQANVPAQFLTRTPAFGPPPPVPAFPLQGPHIGYGMNVELFFQNYNRVLGLVNAAGFNWVKQQIRWADIEPARGQFNFTELDNVVNAIYQNKIQAILSITVSPPWATANASGGFPDNPADLKTFMAALSIRYKNLVAAYEIWNEQNLASAVGGFVDPTKYPPILQAGYQGVKQGDPNAVVLYGGLSPTGVNNPTIAIDDVIYLEATYTAANGLIKSNFDALGAHPGSNNNPPDDFFCPSTISYCPDGGVLGPHGPFSAGWRDHPSFYFRRVENLRDVMTANGDGAKQMWLTEFGWTTANAAPGFEYGAQNTEQDQANFLVRAFQKGKSDYPWMGVMAMWNLNFSTVVPPTDEKFPWAIIHSDFSPRPAYTALSALPKDP